MPDKRGERIGRAACIEPADWEYDGGMYRDFYIKSGLAAVAEAREIDTCDTCKHSELSWCSYHGFNTGTTLRYVGCNRHEPKDET